MTRKKLSVFLMIGAVSLSFAGAALAKEQAAGQDPIAAEAPEQAQIRAEQQSRSNRAPSALEMQQMMGPMMGEMMSGMLRAMSKTMSEPQIAQNFAAFTRNYYKALVAQGFSEEEALKIVMASGLPSVGGGK